MVLARNIIATARYIRPQESLRMHLISLPKLVRINVFESP
jgi:hypothetical protein